ncbi:hypothetical protein [Kurthia sibirica]|uniref:Uncharacterized protein n=1 Tax=Kurthia sibirica TaxID=202750 RepID=A0A2U3AQY3_9BACL|nr:hypothetical protein [Kurthia sibirica]PWI26968.1 hypothetical protein DEX24_01325 [Kurthia sibirica]GEK32483.1 hypothetical protein KSI01_00160 [Kurthia sibirica]
MNENRYPKCHIYSQDSWHDEAYIIGNKKGLEKLRDAINLTLEKGNTKNDFWPKDLEGYDVLIACVEDEVLDDLALPYSPEFYDRLDDEKEAYTVLKKPYYALKD